ncbi:MAG TPA: hypothetical protein VM283_06305 [Armatimonadota bacterium]|nr:hypothetical protein [Armatimonadota bacterium]
MLPRVDFCGFEVSRLIIGGNPFSGFSHQSGERDQEMMNYYTVERIKETLRRAESAGINTTIMRSDNHIHRMLREYYNEGGALQWIAQIAGDREAPDWGVAVRRAVAAGAKAAYLHGGVLDACFADRDAGGFAKLVDVMHEGGVPVGTAGHSSEAHLWAHELDLPLDFHVVCFYNCGSLHDGKGEKFKPEDPPHAVAAIREINKPCIGYKIMAAGRVEPREAFEYAFANIKPGDCVNVGIYRGDRDNMVEDNVALVEDILGGSG